MSINIIAAMDQNRGIGYQNNLLVHIPEDLKLFKEKTINNVVIMGRKTWDSLSQKPLKDRTNIIVTSTPQKINKGNVKFFSLEDAIRYAIICRPQQVYIIGGESIYKAFLPFAKKVYITKIYKAFPQVDSYFPALDNNWELKQESERKEFNGIFYSFAEYQKNI